MGENSVIKLAIASGNIPSLIFWGPPGSGKTTLAYLIAKELKREFFSLSAISSGVKDVRAVIEQATEIQKQNSATPILFIDEIHRFSKSQQDSLLAAIERGLIILIGATTENPSFEVISALLSRCQVYVLKGLSEAELIKVMGHALKTDVQLSKKDVVIKEHEALLRVSGGDARKLLNALELVINAHKSDERLELTNQMVLASVQKNLALYDKAGENHYDIISAFIKSIRGSDPNAAVYWLARMVEGGEDPLFIARRLVILAAEDIGNANPNALVLANSCFQAVNIIGWPESRIILSQAVTYLAASPKSNASYQAISAAQTLVAKTGDKSVPLHLRNAPTKLMKNMDYGRDYQYAHAYENNFVEEEYFPKELSGTKLYEPQDNANENKLRENLRKMWKKKYNY